MKRPQWIVRLLADERGRRYVSPKVEIDGPALAALVGDVIERIADLASYEDSLTEAWFAYVNARRAVVKAEWDLVSEEVGENLIEAMDDARAAVMAELPTAVRLSMAEARMLAGQLDETAGRIGSVAA